MNRIEKVTRIIDIIESNLTQKLDLEQIADKVHYSKYQMHRVFSQTVGLTIHDYVRRRQLTEAAKLLVFSSQPIIDIALASGYESQQAFTDIFSAMYKIPPSRYRENEKFYPLQLRFEFQGTYAMLEKKERARMDIRLATEADVPCVMELVRLIVDGFPYLDETEYVRELKQKIAGGQALVMKDGETAVGILLFSREDGSIDFMGSHPLYRKKGIPRALLDRLMGEWMKDRKISITTFREGDRADNGQREEIKSLGFAEAELLVEYGYPTQRFTLDGEGGQG